MKVMGIDDNGQPVVVELNNSVESSIEAHKRIIKRIKTFYLDWLWSRQAGDRYVNIAQQDFEALLVALDDFITGIKASQLTDGEQKELASFLGSLKG